MRAPAFPPLVLVLAALPLLGAASPEAKLEIEIANLRNAKGVLQVCLTRAPEHFPDCTGDPAAHKRTQPASTPKLAFEVPPGRYAIAIVHDENGNGKLDTVLGIPREGFGFSRNPKIGFGPPKFAQAAFEVGSATVQQVVRVRYLL